MPAHVQIPGPAEERRWRELPAANRPGGMTRSSTDLARAVAVSLELAAEEVQRDVALRPTAHWTMTRASNSGRQWSAWIRTSASPATGSRGCRRCLQRPWATVPGGAARCAQEQMHAVGRCKVPQAVARSGGGARQQALQFERGGPIAAGILRQRHHCPWRIRAMLPRRHGSRDPVRLKPACSSVAVRAYRPANSR